MTSLLARVVALWRLFASSPRGSVDTVTTRLARRGLSTLGKDGAVSTELPSALVISVAQRRARWLLRGLLRFRRIVFVGPGVIVRGKANIDIGSGSTLGPHCQIDGYSREGVKLGKRVNIGGYTIVSCTGHLAKYGRGIIVGDDSGIGEFGYIGAAGGVTIGRDVIMGQYVSFHSQQHRYADVSKLIRQQGTTEAGIVIGDNCWIGAKATFLDGSVVGSHSVVAAGAVVRGEFPSRSLIAGIPAKVLRSLDGGA